MDRDNESANEAAAIAAETEQDILNDIRRNTARTLKLQRISTICAAGMLAALVIALALLVPQALTALGDVSHTLASADEALATLNDVVQQAEPAIEELNVMSRSITQTSEQLSELVEINTDQLTSSVQQLSEVDFEGLNKAIQDFQDAIGPLAAFNKMFK